MNASNAVLDGVDGNAVQAEPAVCRPRSWGRAQWLALTLALTLALATGAGLGWSIGRDERPHRTPPSAEVRSPAVPHLVEHVQPGLGLSIAYPPTWEPLRSSPASVIIDAGDDAAVSIRRFTLASAVDASRLADVRAVTDGVLDTPGAKLTILQVEPIKAQNLVGIYYLYNFPFRGGQGVHAHYFLFRDRLMYSVVFQAASAAQFEALAPTFDAVSATFKAIDGEEREQ